MRFLDQGVFVWFGNWDDFCQFPDLRDDVLVQGEIENFCEVVYGRGALGVLYSRYQVQIWPPPDLEVLPFLMTE